MKENTTKNNVKKVIIIVAIAVIVYLLMEYAPSLIRELLKFIKK
jgi:hypothetical protein